MIAELFSVDLVCLIDGHFSAETVFDFRYRLGLPVSLSGALLAAQSQPGFLASCPFSMSETAATAVDFSADTVLIRFLKVIPVGVILLIMIWPLPYSWLPAHPMGRAPFCGNASSICVHESAASVPWSEISYLS